ncbi:MAG: DUF721 domain-containing protein [Candidatus Omnitrophica bacterium]|nr:DUF721 domain-containing protein [Candidatus Omnitrophota bacterium]
MDNIKDIIGQVIGDLSSGAGQTNAQIQIAWEEITSHDEQKHSRLVGFKEGKLLVVIDSPHWLYQFNLKRISLLKQLQQKINGIKTIYFKVGKAT